MSRPVLGVIACNRIVGSEVAQAVMNRYIRAAMTYADVAALIIPSLPDLMTAAEVAPRIDGILLTGSPSNVATRLYGEDGGDGAYAKGALDVNSVHFQGIGTLADGLTVEARAPDGLIEAYSARPNGAPLLAVQWHPEWGTENDADSQTYFHLLGKALRGNL